MQSTFEKTSPLYDMNSMVQADMLHPFISSSPDVSHSVIDIGVALRTPHSPDLFYLNGEVKTECEKVKSIKEDTLTSYPHHLQWGHLSEEKKVIHNTAVENVAIRQSQISSGDQSSISLRKFYQSSSILQPKPIKHEQTGDVKPIELWKRLEDNEQLRNMQCKVCKAWMITKDFNIWLRNREQRSIRWKRAKCNQCTTMAAIEYDEKEKHVARHNKEEYQHSASLITENTQAIDTTVSVLCSFCKNPRYIHFKKLWEKNTKSSGRYDNLFCKACKQQARLGDWCVPGSRHNDTVRTWLQRYSYNDIFFSKHKHQPPTATVELFTKGDDNDVTVLCSLCNESKVIHFSMLWKRANESRQQRFIWMWCKACKKGARLGRWYIPNKCHHKISIKEWLKRYSYTGVSFYRHDEQPPTATIELFTRTIDSIHGLVSMDVGEKRQRVELVTDNTQEKQILLSKEIPSSEEEGSKKAQKRKAGSSTSTFA